MAVVYADSPYILIILTDRGMGHTNKSVADAYVVFGEISGKIQELNNLFITERRLACIRVSRRFTAIPVRF
jgi:hypothetical protein